MFRLRLTPKNLNIDFISQKKIYFVFSFLLIISSIGLYIANGLNYGIDLKGGILIEVKTASSKANIKDMRSNLSNLGLRIARIWISK